MAAATMTEEEWLDSVEEREARKEKEIDASLAPPTVSQGLVEALFKIFSDGTLSDLQSTLQDPMAMEATLAIQDRRMELRKRQMYNLRSMLDYACRARNTSIIQFLLEFAKTHHVPLKEVIDRYIVEAVIKSSDVPTFQVLVCVMSSVVNFDFSICGTVLSQAIGSDIRTALVAYLLQNGADANGRPHERPLRIAIGGGSLSQVNLLLAHGARTLESVALHYAASLDRVDVLETLLQKGEDINERVGDTAADEWRSKPEDRAQISSETAIYAAVQKRQYEAMKWLKHHGASADLKDVKGQSP